MTKTLCALAVLIFALAGAAAAQTPKSLTVANASVTKTWTITGYDVVIADPANPLAGSVGVRFTLVTSIGEDVLATEAKSATATGTEVMTALLTDVDTRVRAAIAASDPSAYYNGTRAALYAWLQSAGHIDEDAE